MSVGTNVVANPTMSGDEGSLTSLQVGDTKYNVGGGNNHLYCHKIIISLLPLTSTSTSGTTRWFESVALSIITTDNTKFTGTTLAKWLYDNGYNSGTKLYTLEQSYYNNNGNYSEYPFALFSANGTTIRYKAIKNWLSSNSSSLPSWSSDSLGLTIDNFYDNVYQII